MISEVCLLCLMMSWVMPGYSSDDSSFEFTCGSGDSKYRVIVSGPVATQKQIKRVKEGDKSTKKTFKDLLEKLTTDDIARQPDPMTTLVRERQGSGRIDSQGATSVWRNIHYQEGHLSFATVTIDYGAELCYAEGFEEQAEKLLDFIKKGLDLSYADRQIYNIEVKVKKVSDKNWRTLDKSEASNVYNAIQETVAQRANKDRGTKNSQTVKAETKSKRAKNRGSSKQRNAQDTSQYRVIGAIMTVFALVVGSGLWCVRRYEEEREKEEVKSWKEARRKEELEEAKRKKEEARKREEEWRREEKERVREEERKREEERIMAEERRRMEERIREQERMREEARRNARRMVENWATNPFSVSPVF